MMYSWWCEGDRAWLVIESVFIRPPDKGLWACLGDLTQDMSRRSETWVSLLNLCWNPMAFRAAPLSPVRIVPTVTIGRVTLREWPKVKHAIAGYLRLPRPTPAPAMMRELHWHRGWAEVPGYATGNPPEDYSCRHEEAAASLEWLL